MAYRGRQLTYLRAQINPAAPTTLMGAPRHYARMNPSLMTQWQLEGPVSQTQPVSHNTQQSTEWASGSPHRETWGEGDACRPGGGGCVQTWGGCVQTWGEGDTCRTEGREFKLYTPTVFCNFRNYYITSSTLYITWVSIVVVTPLLDHLLVNGIVFTFRPI